MTNKDKYRELCANESSIPLFLKDWWLDSTCQNGKWDVALIEKNGRIHAALPYYLESNLGLNKITQPPLTQYTGPWLRSEPNLSHLKRLSREKELLTKLEQLLPKVDSFYQHWSPAITNWLPFFWRGYQQTNRVTYRLYDLDKCYESFHGNVKKSIKKASRNNIKINKDDLIEEFIKLNKKTFARQGISLPYTEGYLRNLDHSLAKLGRRKIFLAYDEEGVFHSGVYLVWDDNTAYYLMGGVDPLFRSSGAMSLCMWEAIKFSNEIVNTFDFEGSMIEPIEKFFRTFGANQVSYHAVSKVNSPLLKCVDGLKMVKNGLLRK